MITCVEARRAALVSSKVHGIYEHLHVLEVLWLSVKAEVESVAAVVKCETAWRTPHTAVQGLKQCPWRLRVGHDVEVNAFLAFSTPV